jgi:hypothetical protein
MNHPVVDGYIAEGAIEKFTICYCNHINYFAENTGKELFVNIVEDDPRIKTL